MFTSRLPRVAYRGLERIRVGARAGEFRRVDQLLRLLQVAAGRGRDGLRQQQPGAGPDQIGGQRRKPALDRRRFAALAVGRVEMPLDQPGGRGHLAGGDGVPDGLIGQPVLLVPAGRVAVQLRHLAGPFGLQAGAEQVGEQMVVAPPSAHLVQRDQEQPGPVHLLQQRLAAGPAGDRVTQLARQPVQHRGLQQEGAHLLALPLQHLFGQIIEHVAVAAGEGSNEAGHVLLPAQRQGGQLQPGRPPLGPGHQRRHGRLGQRHVGPGPGLLQQPGRLAGREPQIRGAHLGELPAGP